MLTSSVSVSAWLFTLLSLLPSYNLSQTLIEELSCTFRSDDLCNWQLEGGSSYNFEPMFNASNLDYDIDDNPRVERVLVIRLSEENRANDFAEFSLKSPTFETGDYELNFNLNMNFRGYVFVIVVNDKNIESQILKIIGSQSKIWETYSIKLPKNDKINVILEFKFEHMKDTDYIAINNINIVNKRRVSKLDQCYYKCSQSEKCIARSQICDTVLDCPQEDDESQECDKLPKGSYCSFQNNLCGWFNYDSANSSGHWIYLENEGIGAVFRGEHQFGVTANLKSVIFAEIPLYHSIVSSQYYQTCQISFSYLFSATSAELSLVLEPQVEHSKLHSIRFWRYFNKKHITDWRNVTETLPVNFHYKYRLRFSAALGLRSSSSFTQTKSVSINRVSLSKECFGIDVPESEPRIPSFLTTYATTESFRIPNENHLAKSYRFTTCGARGRQGPSYSQCEAYYLNTTTRAAIFEIAKLNGSQMWTVPKSGYYSLFARGADGGKGLYGHSGGKGALVRSVFYLSEGDTLFLLIGQAGTDACNPATKDEEQCKPNYKYSNQKPRVEVGGGGGGGTYIFQLKPSSPEDWIPLLIAGGGGGGSGKINPDHKYSINQNGQGFDFYNIGAEGNGDGSGGGWNFTSVSKMEGSQQSGKSLLFGGEGGLTCRRHAKWQTDGGFGSAGAGCTNGGGGGGYHGGNANKYSEAGDGGTSFVDFEKSFLQSYSDTNKEPNYFEQQTQDGEVIIVPQIDACCNQNLLPCLIAGEASNGTVLKHCICGVDKFMAGECLYERMNYLTLIWVILCILLFFLLIFLVSFIVTQKRSAKKKLERNNNDASGNSTELQVTKMCNHQIDTTINPNYEFGGSTCSLQDLPEIPREKLNLVKALGQGAFGEVYQGSLHNYPGEVTDELPVAVKTLPEYSATKQSEMDFLLEALIMSKFKHRNVVRFIGVCFDKMPRFIVLELLPGGDLKTFLRENRSTMEQKSQLVMGDLLVMALDIAHGCQYLEERHFIHRDIAARNCLLTSKLKMPSSKTSVSSNYNYENGFNNSGIVAKIADFGMARDIYRADYYRKGGKTMLPVKWMPPEAFLDGVFTAKTDVWSFGVLLWEVMSMGYMPYPGRGNQEVMQLVTAGGRLEAPNSSTPAQVYLIMAQCWNSTPEFRPNFAAIIEKLEQCLQDPNVLEVSLPIFHRAASMEKDITLMRPPPDATDYLVPNNLGSATASNYSMTTEKTELLSPDTCSTLSCMNEDESLPIITSTVGGTMPAALWSSAPMNGAIPLGLNVNNMTYNIVPSEDGQFNPEIILQANSLAYPNVRYMNVNVNTQLYNPDQADNGSGANNA